MPFKPTGETDGKTKCWQRAATPGELAPEAAGGRLELALLPPEPKEDKAVQTSPAVTITDGMMHSGATADSPKDEMTGWPMKSNCGLCKAWWGNVLRI